MSIFEVAKKVANLLKGRTIYFDFKSYDDENDIPHIFDGKTRCNVEVVRFNDNGDFFEIITESVAMGIQLYDITEEEFEKDANEIGLYELLMDIYYETDESQEIGDFEFDFLKTLPQFPNEEVTDTIECDELETYLEEFMKQYPYGDSRDLAKFFYKKGYLAGQSNTLAQSL